MNELDEEILSELRKDAKIKLKTLSRKLSVPLSTLYLRIKKMEKEGLIRNYTINVDWPKLGYKLRAYVLVYVDTTKLKELRKTQQEIQDEMRTLPFVETADMVTGDSDLLLTVRARDTDDLGKMLTERLQAIPGIVNTKTLVCIR